MGLTASTLVENVDEAPEIAAQIGLLIEQRAVTNAQIDAAAKMLSMLASMAHGRKTRKAACSIVFGLAGSTPAFDLALEKLRSDGVFDKNFR